MDRRFYSQAELQCPRDTLGLRYHLDGQEFGTMFPQQATFGFGSDGIRVDYQSSSRQRWIAMCTADNIKLAECLDRFTLQAHGST